MGPKTMPKRMRFGPRPLPRGVRGAERPERHAGGVRGGAARPSPRGEEPSQPTDPTSLNASIDSYNSIDSIYTYNSIDSIYTYNSIDSMYTCNSIDSIYTCNTIDSIYTYTSFLLTPLYS